MAGEHDEAVDDAGERTPGTGGDPVRLAFVCVQNAGRSQMATAFAERIVRERGLEDRVEVMTGGTDPADAVHEGVVAAMAEVGLDVADRTPRRVDPAALRECDYVATMGCSTLDLGEVEGTTVRDWALPDPDGEPPERVREVRETVRERVESLLEEAVASE